MPKNVYIHIPFCRSKCKYCSFVSYNELHLKELYLKALKKQIETEYKGEKLKTLYFGGGTPSLLSIDEFKNLLDIFHFQDNVEITVEVNPESVNLDYLSKLKNLGVNRLSIGAQTFDDKLLQLIGRGHNSEQTKSALNCARKVGFKNISLDLIYGLPTQNLKDWEDDLKKVISLDVQHISLYGLKLEMDCYFYQNMPQSLPDSDLQADMYLKAVEMLQNAGYNHYEISNFAKSGFESKHNLNYWDNNTYYGFGCAASGYVNKIRYTNEINLERYINNSFSKIFENKLSEQEILEEAIFLGLRKTAGININEINKKFKIDFWGKYIKILDKYSDFFVKTAEGCALTLNGILISNEILAEFISD